MNRQGRHRTEPSRTWLSYRKEGSPRPQKDLKVSITLMLKSKASHNVFGQDARWARFADKPSRWSRPDPGGLPLACWANCTKIIRIIVLAFNMKLWSFPWCLYKNSRLVSSLNRGKSWKSWNYLDPVWQLKQTAWTILDHLGPPTLFNDNYQQRLIPPKYPKTDLPFEVFQTDLGWVEYGWIVLLEQMPCLNLFPNMISVCKFSMASHPR